MLDTFLRLELHPNAKVSILLLEKKKKYKEDFFKAMHETVLLKEAVEALDLEPGDVAVDATLGAGGHAIQIAKLVGEKGKVIAFDLDRAAILQSQERIRAEQEELLERIIFKNDNFSKIKEVVGGLNLEDFEGVDAILADLGWRSEQIENEKYGLSFQKESRLDMRLGAGDSDLDARQIVNQWSAEDLVRIFKDYGEERGAKVMAAAIVKARNEKPIETTTELADLARRALNRFYRKQKIHPATRIFQALRIAVNDELDNLKKFLNDALEILEPGGRIAVISFHSLEDRMVKRFFADSARGCVCPRDFPKCVCGKKPKLKIVTRKPIVSSEEEIRKNPRARSAKLRVAEKVD